MHETALNPALIRVLIIALFLIMTQILRAVKTSKAPKPPARAGAGNAPQRGETLRDAMRQAAEQARARRSGQSTDGPSPTFSDSFQQQPFQQPSFDQPPAIEPESSFIPSLLLLALLGCLCLMAYRYWAG